LLSIVLTAGILIAAVVLVSATLQRSSTPPASDRTVMAEPPSTGGSAAPDVGAEVPAPVTSAPAAANGESTEVAASAPPPEAEPVAKNGESAEAAKPAEGEVLESVVTAEEGATRSDTFSDQDAPFTIVKVFYATDRKPTGASDPNEKYGGDRGTLVLGEAEVSIPRDHRLGELESPSIWRLEFSEDPEKHVVLKAVSEATPETFYKGIREKVAAAPDKSAFIFVHGYNVLFKDAARRTAQMTYDLGFPGAPVFYSWPSQGTTFGYLVDETNVQWTEANLKRFIKEFADLSTAENIYLVAHSMGNRALTGAIKDLVKENPDIRNRFKEIILAAPDIDAEIFKRDIAPFIVTATPTVTLYASSNDKALIASKQAHGYARAGDSGGGLVIISGVDTIDSTNAETDFVGHAYYASSKSIIADIFNLIHRRQRPDARPGLKAIDQQAGRYWEFLGVGTTPP
jgi:esterase/lipase superfamily enzyme